MLTRLSWPVAAFVVPSGSSKLWILSITPFFSYLINRNQVVRIHSSVSDPLPVECGVPQGSILGPLLFSIYVNDLPEVPRHCSTECYVDDAKLFVSFNLHDSQRIVQEMNEDLLQVRNWCFGNRLLLNPDKTKLIVFGSRQIR